MSLRLNAKRGTAIVAGGAAMLALSACMPANNVPETLAFAGSDTTQDLMGAIVGEYNADANWNKDPDTLVNVLSQELTGGKFVPGDANCGDLTYATPAGPGQVLAPNGSSNGRNALKASVQNGDGCVDVARSSGPPRAIGSDLATFEYYAFALDALGWSSASTKAPSNLTLTQLRGIYNCSFTNWSQVGGTAGPIERYLPQAGSGTYQFFTGTLLGFDPAAFSGPSCPAVQFTQENSGEVIATNGDEETALVGYSMANWIAQARGTQPDQRDGQVLRDLNGQNLVTYPGGVPTPNTAGPVNENNVELVNPTPSYPGIRFVFNVIDSTHVNYSSVKRAVGFINEVPSDSASASPLCNGQKAGTLQNFGFGPLDTTTGPNNLLGSTCRLFTP